MKYVKLFEEYSYLDDFDVLMGKLLRLYSSIPLTKDKSSVVIKKILRSINVKYDFYNTRKIDLNFDNFHDKIRFYDYFDSLINSKNTRGHNFEGFLAGVYDIELSDSKNTKYDLITDDGKKISAKFIDFKSKAPEIGNFKEIIKNYDDENHTNYLKKIEDLNGLSRIFQDDQKSISDDLKEQLFKILFDDIDIIIIAFYDEENNKINLYFLNRSVIYSLLKNGYVGSPKGGYKSLYSLAFTSNYHEYAESNGSKVVEVILPEVTIEDLRLEYKILSDDDWSKEVFGNISYKIRPDVMRQIKSNRGEIIKKMIDYDKKEKENQ